jgi:hypothetical protein
MKKALDRTLDVVGLSIKQWIFEDMLHAGIISEPGKSHSINQIRAYFEWLAGKDVAELDRKVANA